MSTRRGRIPSQNKVIDRLRELAGYYGCQVNVRRQNSNGNTADIKKFMPDVFVTHYSANSRRICYIYEVEKTVTNNNIFKSIMSLVNGIMHQNASRAYLVVPRGKEKFAERCIEFYSESVQFFSKRGRGAPKKIRIEVINFDSVSNMLGAIKKWDGKENRRRGERRPHCEFLPA